MRRIFGRATLGFLELSERMKQWIEIGYDPLPASIRRLMIQSPSLFATFRQNALTSQKG